MSHDWQRIALEHMFSALESKTHPMAERESHVPIEVYRSKAKLEQEKQYVFRRYPMAVGVSAQVRNAGDFFTHDGLGMPILVTRAGSGTLHAFLNVCRHRGAKLVEARCGTGRSSLVCRYHGWSYWLDGRLRGVPHPCGFPELERGGRALVSLPVAERSGLVFVQLAPEPVCGLDEYAQPLFNELDTFDLASRSVFACAARTIRGNWKVMAETMLEVYHISVLHKNTGGPAFEQNICLFEPLAAPSGRFVIPLKGARRPNSADHDEWRLLYHAAAVYWIFPNTFIFLLGRFAHVISVFPVDEAQCVVQSFALIDDPGENEMLRAGFNTLYDWYWATIDEDIEIVESIQAGLATDANQEFLLGRYEHYIDTYFHAELNRAIQPAR